MSKNSLLLLIFQPSTNFNTILLIYRVQKGQRYVSNGCICGLICKHLCYSLLRKKRYLGLGNAQVLFLNICNMCLYAKLFTNFVSNVGVQEVDIYLIQAYMYDIINSQVKSDSDCQTYDSQLITQNEVNFSPHCFQICRKRALLSFQCKFNCECGFPQNVFNFLEKKRSQNKF